MSYLIQKKNNTFLVTGAAGFIGFFLSKRLLEQGCKVIGIDNINSYYDVGLKMARLEQLKSFQNFVFERSDISDKGTAFKIFNDWKPEFVIHLAAQAGVRYSLENPDVYIQSNIVGFYNILEACRCHPVKHLIYASSSSVYGSNKKVPFEESDFVDNPISLYAATKKSNELMAYTYNHLYDIPTTGLRFFTVYGPMGRPDMAYFKFTDDYFKGKPIEIFNNGDFKHDLYRDFTYIDDIVEGVIRLLNRPDEDKATDKVYNIGNNCPVKLMDFISTLEKCLGDALGKGVIFEKVFKPIKPGDVPATYASIELLKKSISFQPKTSIYEGLQAFANWYIKYYEIK